MEATDLTTLGALKAWLNAPASDTTQDANLAAIISGVSRLWLNWTGRATLNSLGTYSEWYDGPGANPLLPRNAPVTAITALNILGVAVPQSTDHLAYGWVLSDDGLRVYLVGWAPVMPQLYMTRGPYGISYAAGGFGRVPQSVQLAYTAGYAPLAVSGESQTVPAQQPNLLAFSSLNEGPWVSDSGVSYAGGSALTKVTGAPAQGQYALESTGYLFATADAGAAVEISYSVGNPPDDVQQAVLQHCTLVAKRASRPDTASDTIPGASIIAYRRFELPPEVQRVIDVYRRRVA